MTDDRQALYQRLKPLLVMPEPPRGDGRIWSYCPAHGDGAKHGRKGGRGGGRSLSLHPKFGLECFAGCEFTAILEALGANDPKNRRDERPAARPQQQQQKPRSSGGMPPEATLVKVYDYVDPFTGRVLAHKGRFEWRTMTEKGYDKAFSWWLPGEPPKSGLKGGSVADLPLWGADLVVKADADRVVWICEGEKAVEALRARHELAVCLSQGASAREFGDSLDILENRRVRLWPDLDSKGMGQGLMDRLALVLQPIAQSVEMVVPPAWLGEHGDAHEFFSMNGKLDELPLRAVTGLTTVTHDDDHFTVQVLTEAGHWVAFEFEELAFGSGRTLDASLTVSLKGKGLERTPYKQRMNLRSGSSRSSLETALNKHFKKDAGVNWTLAMSKAWDAAETAFRRASQPIGLSEDDDVSETFLIPDLLPEEGATILFGDGSAGKSYLAAGIAAAVSVGFDFADRPAVQRNVLYLDWETTARTWKRRMHRVLEGMGFDASLASGLPVHYWRPAGRPLVEVVAEVRAMVADLGIGLVIIDSGGFACDGPPEESQPAINFWNALGRIDATKLVLCHVSKEALKGPNPPDRPFGSQYWHNGARRTWYVARSSEPEADQVELGLYCKKVNDGPMPRGIGLDMVFDGRSGPVDFRTKPIENTMTAVAHQTDRERALDYLRQHGRATTGAIGEALGLTPRNAYQVLNRFPDSFVRLKGADMHPGQEWGIRERREAEVPYYQRGAYA